MAWYERDGPDSAEARFEAFYNYSGETIEAGSAICLDITTAANGARIVQPSPSGLGVFVGIAHESAVDGALFPVQTRGYRATGAKVINDTITAVAVGDILVPVGGQWYLTRSGPPDGKSGFIFACELYSPSNPVVVALKRVYIRA